MYSLVHFGSHRAEAMPVETKLHVGMISQERHRHRRIGESLGDHQCGEPHAEGVVVIAGLPDRNFFGFPRFDGQTVAARVGTSATCPPPEVRAF